MKFKCDRCGYFSGMKTCMRNHFMRKNPCSPLLCDIPIEELLQKLDHVEEYDKHRCEYCNKGHKNRHSLCYHKKVCPERPDESDVTSVMERLCKALEKFNSNSTHTTTNNIQNQQNIQINLNNYGSERIEFTPEQLTQFCANCYEGIGNMFKLTHFNLDAPENKNIRSKNIEKNLLEIYQDNQWITVDKNSILDAVIDKNAKIMYQHFENNKNDEDVLKRNEDILYTFFLDVQRKMGKRFFKLRRDLYGIVLADGVAPLYLRLV